MDPLNRIEAKLDQVQETLVDQAVTLAKNTASLETHIRRTDLLEGRMEPLTAAHQRWVGAGKAAAAAGAVVAVLAGLVAVAEGAAHVLGHFTH